MMIEMDCLGGGGDSYAMSEWSAKNAYTVLPSFTNLKGTPKAILLIVSGETGIARIFSNVNPTTGEIDNDSIYYADSQSASTATTWALWNGSMSFIVNGNSVSTSAIVIGANHRDMIFYTY